MNALNPLKPVLDEHFGQARLDSSLRWYCEPPSWSMDSARGLCLAPDAQTDYWQRTHYGFQVDNGHFLFAEIEGDFVMTTCVVTRPVHQYDQAGLMVRLSDACWLKTSVEFEPDEPNRLGAVVTNAGYSDWSTQPLSHAITTTWFRVRVEGQSCTVEASLDGAQWQQIRLAHLQELGTTKAVKCGLYACSPKASGFEAEFKFLKIEQE